MPPDSDGAAGAAHPLTEFSHAGEPLHGAPVSGRLARFLRAWAAVENTVVGLLALATLCIVIYTIFMRFFIPRLTPSWTDETAVYLMIWATFIALSAVTAQNAHVRADLVTNSLSARPRAALELLSYICGAAFAAVLTWYGYAVTKDAFEFGDLSTTTMRFPMWIYYACLPVGAGLMTLRYALLAALMMAGYGAPRRAH
jgi:TRAP-type C4-dicarboxylate transport system permease small subunit